MDSKHLEDRISFRSRLNNIACLSVISATTFLSGCGFLSFSIDGKPRPRIAGYPTDTIGSVFTDINGIGKHSYFSGISESAGMVYTCRGGHIDMDHFRIAADNTKWLYEKTKSMIQEEKSNIKFKLTTDPEIYYAKIIYPTGWKNLTSEARSKITEKVSLDLGEYLAYNMVNFHEVMTWYGFKSIGIFSEFSSAFSWEDSYSNRAGTSVAVRAISDKEIGYDKAMDNYTREELIKLGARDRKVSLEASRMVKGNWYKGAGIPEMIKRNFDIGFDDGSISPSIVPNVPGCDCEPYSYPAPRLENFKKYGFVLEFEVSPNSFESGRIRKAAGVRDGGRLKLPDAYIPLMADMKREARKLGYHYLE